MNNIIKTIRIKGPKSKRDNPLALKNKVSPNDANNPMPKYNPVAPAGSFPSFPYILV